MSNLIRTTVTIPRDIYLQARVVAAHRRASFSQLVSATLKKSIAFSDPKVKDPFKIAGSLHLGINRAIHRSEIYDDQLHRKMGD